MNLPEIQEAIRDQGFDGWLFFDHHRRDPLAYRILNLAPEQTPSRRWYYLIPRTGEPQKLVHRIESIVLDKLPGEKLIYSSWTSQTEALGKLLSGRRRVAMQYSPNCANFHMSINSTSPRRIGRLTCSVGS